MVIDKKSLDLLEKAFAAEVEGAVSGGVGMLQTKSLTAKRLAESGYLDEKVVTLSGNPPVTVRGFALTHLGRAEYCMSDRCS